MQRLTSKIKAIPGAATQRVEDVVLLTRALISQTIILIISFYLLFLLSTFIYGSFYFAFVPAPIHQGPVHLIFEPCQEKMGKCGFLNASVVLSDRNPILMTGQQYTLTLSLEMPESDNNKNLGMFMNCVQLLSNDNNVVRNACRSAMLKYRSDIIRKLELFFAWPIILTGYSDEKQWVHIQLLDDFLDDPIVPAIGISFQLMSRYAEVYSATFQIQAKFSGLRYLMYYYPITAAIFGISFNMSILAAVFILSWHKFFAKTDPIMEENEDLNYRDPFEDKSGDNGERIKDEEESESEDSILSDSIEKIQEVDDENKETLKKDL